MMKNSRGLWSNDFQTQTPGRKSENERELLFFPTFLALAYYLCIRVSNSCTYAIITMTQETKSTE